MYKLKYPFDGRLVSTIKKHLESEWPKEAGGIVVNNKYIPCQNKAEDDTEVFEFDEGLYLAAEKEGEIQALIHSHNDCPHASQADMELQQLLNVPFGIVSIKNGKANDAFFWGDCMEPSDLIGRPFHHGVHDCYGLVRDYYKKELGVWIKQYPRDYGWWKQDPPLNLLKDGYKEAGFIDIPFDEARPGDALFFQIRYKVVNHSAIYLGRGLILHHFCAPGVISRKEPLNRWKKFQTHTLRYVGVDHV